MTVSSAAHGRAKAGSHDSVAPCCVATKEVRVRDRPSQARTTEVSAQQGNSVAIDLDSDEKKKKKPWIRGVTLSKMINF